MASSKPFVYWGSGSPPCWKVLLVLHEKNVAYDEKLISFAEKGHKTEEVLKLNPRGQVPTFYDGDIVINESTAICLYLEEKHENNPLFPADLASKAKVYQRMFEVSNIGTNVIESIVYYKVRSKDNINQDLLKDKKEKAHTELQRWEEYLTKTGSYIATSSFTMADVFFFPALASIIRQGANLESRYPQLMKYYNLVKDRPSIVKTMPPHWATDPSPHHLADLCD